MPEETKLGIAQIPIRATLDDLQKDLDKAKGQVEKSMEGISGRVASSLGKIGSAAILGGIGLATAAVAGIGTAAFKSAMTVDEAYDTIMTKTGATGQELQDLKDDFGTVFGNFAGDAGDVSNVLADLNARLGITGPDLQTLGIQILQTSQLLGGDATQRTQLFTRVLGDWGVAVEDGSAVMDKFFKASQLTGAGIDGLMQKAVQFGAPLRLMGFTLDDTISLFAKWEKEGVNAELVMGSLRIAAGNFAKDGTKGNKSLRESLMDTFAAIQTTKDETWALSEGMRVFGARAGPDMVAAIREGRFSIDDLTKALGDSEGAIWNATQAVEDWPEKWQKLKNVATLALAPIGAKLMDIATGLLETAMPAMDRLMAFVSTTVMPIIEKIGPAVGRAFGAFGKLGKGDLPGFLGDLKEGLYGIAEAFGLARERVAPVVETLTNLAGTLASFVQQTLIPFVRDHAEGFKGAIIAIAGVLAGAGIAQIIGGIVAAFNPFTLAIIAVMGVVALLGAAWAENWGGIRDKLTAFWTETAQPILAELVAWLQEHIPMAIAALKEFWTGTLLPALTTVWEFIQNSVIPAFLAIVNWLATNIPKAIKTATDAWNTKLLPALNAIWDFIRTYIVPIFNTLINIWIATMKAEVILLAGIWNNILKPALWAVWDFVSTWLGPVLRWLGGIVIASLKEMVSKLAETWNMVLKPALEAIWNFVKDHIGPKLEWLANTVLAGVRIWLENVRDGLQWVIEKFQSLWGWAKDVIDRLGGFRGIMEDIRQGIDNALKPLNSLLDRLSSLWDWLGRIRLPNWLTPGSPTPFELGLRGIAEALEEINSMELRGFEAKVAVSSIPVRSTENRTEHNYYLDVHYDQYESELSLRDLITGLRMV